MNSLKTDSLYLLHTSKNIIKCKAKPNNKGVKRRVSLSHLKFQAMMIQAYIFLNKWKWRGKKILFYEINEWNFINNYKIAPALPLQKILTLVSFTNWFGVFVSHCQNSAKLIFYVRYECVKLTVSFYRLVIQYIKEPTSNHLHWKDVPRTSRCFCKSVA